MDKTAYVWELVNGDQIYFLSRPRRFGKSLLLSTFEAFFKAKRDLFKGLAIDTLAPEPWEEYPVVRLDMAFAAAPDAGVVEKRLQDLVDGVARANKLPSRGDDAATRFKNLIADLAEQSGRQVVILVDEYDKPILDNIGTPAADEVLNCLRGFYQVIKSSNDLERFVFITGVTKFAHTSIFSGMNNPTDLTMRDDAATLLGYTQEELESNFADYIDAAAAKLNLPRADLLAKIKEWYNGFRFHADSPTVYNPVSVGKFFVQREFLNYWYDTGTPKFLVDVTKKHPFKLNEAIMTPVSADEFDKYDIDRLDPFIFAVQTGYLTIRESREVRGDRLYWMNYPNREVQASFQKFLLETSLGNPPRVLPRLLNSLADALEAGDENAFLRALQPVFAGFPWGNLGDPGDDPIKFYEGYFRNLLSLAFSLIDVDNTPEVRTSDGVADLVARYLDWTFVFELKMRRDGEDTDKLLDAALDQAVNRKHYAEKYRDLSKHVKVIAIVFDSATRRLAAWKSRE